MNPATAPAASASAVSNYEWEIIQWRRGQDSYFGTVTWMGGIAFTIVPHARFGFCVYGPLIEGSKYYPDVIAAQQFCLAVALQHLQRVHTYLTDNGALRLLPTNRERIEENERATHMAIFYGVCVAIALSLGLYGLFAFFHNYF